jgi:sulfite reductase (NADPH) flavoprotein alpha-component
MVGPGTGIAPFRAFLEERRARGDAGRNWLFFGDQKQSRDFLYREEIETMHGSGFLTRLDLAFSRDQAEKVYVQDRMLENSRRIFAWLEEGAHFAVCGDAKRMAKDVDAALHRIVAQEGGMTEEKAKEYVEGMRKEKRYVRDVY